MGGEAGMGWVGFVAWKVIKVGGVAGMVWDGLGWVCEMKDRKGVSGGV